MTLTNVVEQLKKLNPELAELYDNKHLKSLVEEQLFLRDYKINFPSELSENSIDDEEEIELEPEEIPIEPEKIETVPEEPEEIETVPDESEEIPTEEPEFEPEVEVEVEPENIPSDKSSPEVTPQTTPKDKLSLKDPEADGYIRISPEQARELLSYKGKIFTAIFTKRSDGTLRSLNGMTGVRKYTSGGELPYSPKEKELIPVYDLKKGPGKKGYRTIPIEGLKALKMNGKKYKIDQALKEIKVLSPKLIKHQYNYKEIISQILMDEIKFDIEENSNYIIRYLVQDNEEVGNLIKNDMVKHNHNVIRKGKEYLVTYDSELTETELREWFNENNKLKEILNNIIFKYYQTEIFDINNIEEDIYKEFRTRIKDYDNEDLGDKDVIEGDISYITNEKLDSLELRFSELVYDEDFHQYLYQSLSKPVNERKVKYTLNEIKILKPQQKLKGTYYADTIDIEHIPSYGRYNRDKTKIRFTLDRWDKKDTELLLNDLNIPFEDIYQRENGEGVFIIDSKYFNIKNKHEQQLEEMKKSQLRQIVKEALLEVKASKVLKEEDEKGKTPYDYKSTFEALVKKVNLADRSQFNSLKQEWLDALGKSLIKPSTKKSMIDQVNKTKSLLDLQKFGSYGLVNYEKMRLKENQPMPTPQRQSPDRETIEKPDVDEPKKTRRRTLTPPIESPDTKPKAEGVEKDLSKKIASRFQKLK